MEGNVTVANLEFVSFIIRQSKKSVVRNGRLGVAMPLGVAESEESWAAGVDGY